MARHGMEWHDVVRRDVVRHVVRRTVVLGMVQMWCGAWAQGSTALCIGLARRRGK